MLNEMSVSDLKTIGLTLRFSETLDNHKSVRWNYTAVDKNGMGFTNNKPFIQSSTVVPGGFDNQNSMQAAQNTIQLTGVYNIKLDGMLKQQLAELITIYMEQLIIY